MGINEIREKFGARKLASFFIALMIVTGGAFVFTPFMSQDAEAWVSPDVGLMMTFSDIAMMTGGFVVEEIMPGQYLVHETITIMPSDTLRLMGGEQVFIDPGMGISIEIMGTFDGMMGFGAMFMSAGPMSWNGFWIPGGMFSISGATIMDANIAVDADNSIMTNVDNCMISNCFTGVRYNMVMGGPQIFFNQIQLCDIGIETIDSTSQIMGNTISDGFMDGIRVMAPVWGLGPTIDDNDISNFAMSGISASGVDGMWINNNDIFDNQGDAISLIDTRADIMNNRIFGGNATPGSGMPGGNGISIGGTASFGTTISDNTIIGGQGDDYMFMPPNGGHAIWVNAFEGNAMNWPQLSIHNNTLLQGGRGGNNTMDGQDSGDGGDGIRIEGIPDIDPGAGRKTLEIVDNLKIIGGRGGDNNCLANGTAGNGGFGIRIIEDDFMGSQLIARNAFIRGGDGGHNNADDTEWDSNWACGNGGDGLFIQDAWMMVPTVILHNPYIEGGDGGNSTATGQFKKAGLGGDGIDLVACDNTLIDPTRAYGGDGGDNTGMMLMAGDGGDGILIRAIADRFSNVQMIDVNGTGGEGGDNYIAGGAGAGGAGTGGDGLEVDGGSMVMSMASNYTGGRGGDTYADMDSGGSGGRGIYVWNASMLNAFVGTIIGGRGGDTRYNGPPGVGSFGGYGGYGVYAHDALTFFDINSHYISGGSGGDNLFDTLGWAGTGDTGVEAFNMDMVQLMDSEVVAGPGGTDYVNAVPSVSGTYGVDVNSVSMGAILDNITVHEANSFGVFFGQTDGMLANSEIYNSGMGPTSCGVIALMSSDPLIADNYVHNCTSGILIGTNSNPDVQNNLVENSQYYGMYIYGNSHPHIQTTTVDNSGEYGMRMLGGTTSLVENSTISNSGIADWYLDENSHPISLNTSNDKTVVVNDALSDLTMQWYLHTLVVDQLMAPVAGATVWINDTFGTNVLTGTTPANGWINWTVLTEFIESQAGRTDYTDHNGTATSGLLYGWTTPDPTMDQSQDTLIVLGGTPSLAVTKEGPSTAYADDIISYWINITNNGNDNALNVVVTDTYPAGVVFIGSVPAPDIPDNIWLIPAIAPSATVSIEINVQILAGTSGIITNQVDVDYENILGASLPTETDTWDTDVLVATSWDIYNGRNYLTFSSALTPGWMASNLAEDIIAYMNANHGEDLVQTDVEITMYNSVAGSFQTCYYIVGPNIWFMDFALAEGDGYIVSILNNKLDSQPLEYTLPNQELTAPIPLNLYNGWNYRGIPVSSLAMASDLALDIISYMNVNYGEVLANTDVEITMYNSVAGSFQTCYFIVGPNIWFMDFAIAPESGYIISILNNALATSPRAYTPS